MVDYFMRLNVGWVDKKVTDYTNFTVFLWMDRVSRLIRDRGPSLI